MTKRLFRSIGTLCLLALTSLFFSGCQTAPPSSEPPFDPDETGFESLFDGKTFGDWKPNERAANWKIEDGEWFDYSILVNGQNIVTRINGRIISDYTEAPGCEGGRKIGKGYIALQQHDPGSVVRFRNLRIKRLP